MDQLSAHHSALRPSQKDNIHSNSGDLVSPEVVQRDLSSCVCEGCQ